MSFQLFHDLFPDLAERENRCILITVGSALGLPPGHYFFKEMFCNEPGCDCRRVFFYVGSSIRRDVEAVIGWGWESPAFYAKWLHDDNPYYIAEIKGPSLNVGSPQTVLAPAILELTRTVLLRDDAYVSRVKEHYRLFRTKIDGKTAGRKKRGAKT